MSEQALDKILVRHPKVDLGDLKVDRILTRCDAINLTEYELNYVPACRLPTDLGFSTNLHRGYVATFELMANGELVLVMFEFPYSGRDTENVCGKIRFFPNLSGSIRVDCGRLDAHERQKH
jgi:hypothetical protein